jgi:16S rRNA (guanine527-N7)-methyltransferase
MNASTFSANNIRDVFKALDLAVSKRVCEQFAVYLQLLLRWNQRISLTSIDLPDEIARTHFAESLLATKVGIEIRGRLADVGTGAGFPGLPLKIYLPELDLTLIEPNAKKCAFLGEVSRTLGLTGVHIVQKRYEDVRRPELPFDLVTARALGQFSEFMDWADTVLAVGGRVMVWTGPDGRVELERKRKWKWLDPYVISQSKHRLIVGGSL